MTTPIFDLVTGRETLEELTDHVARMTKQLNFMMNKNLSSRNIREIGNWVVGSDYFRSRDGQVGISSAGTSGDSIRFWAGSSNPASAPWRVTHSGQMVASNANITGIVTATGGFIGGWSILPDRLSGSGIIQGGTIIGSLVTGATISGGFITGAIVEGGVVRSGPVGTSRIELSGTTLSGYTASNQYVGLRFDISGSAADIGIYKNGIKMMEFYDQITHYQITPGVNNVLEIGAYGKTVQASGNWNFSSGVSGTVYVASSPGGPTNIPITFTSGLRTM